MDNTQNASIKQTRNPLNSNLTLATLLTANLLTIIFFIFGKQSIMQALWVYWFQSIIIGLVNVIRILSSSLKIGTTKNDQGISATINHGVPSNIVRMFMAAFFVFHYGMFHLVYLVFLITLTHSNTLFGFANTPITVSINSGISVSSIALSSVSFAIHHLLSFIAEQKYFKQQPQLAPTTSTVFGRPYARIIPMHIIIIFGPLIAMVAGNAAVFVVFMILKSAMDWKLYLKGTGHPINVGTTINRQALTQA